MAADSAHDADAVEAVRQWVNSARFDEELIELETQMLRAMLAIYDAAVAELEWLRAEVAELGDEWSYETKNGWSGWRRCTTPLTEEYARKRAGDSERNRLVHRKASEWRVVDTAPQQPAQPCPSTAVSDDGNHASNAKAAG